LELFFTYLKIDPEKNCPFWTSNLQAFSFPF
jgi:hypothetical protein